MMEMTCPYCRSESIWKQPEYFSVIGNKMHQETEESMCGGDSNFEINQFKCGGCLRVFYLEDE